MKNPLRVIGPALIVAAVVLGPGSILTSSKVGATYGLLGLPVIAIATVLMIGMVALSARLGAVYKGSLCDELSDRLGRPITIAVGVILFTLVALFQSSNNIALVAGLEPMLETNSAEVSEVPTSQDKEPMSFAFKAGLLVAANLLVVSCLFVTRDLYRFVERAMKMLIFMMVCAFLVNFAVVWINPPEGASLSQGRVGGQSGDMFALLGMIGTTFSVAGAFYQAYLVKEKGWGLKDVQAGLWDSVVSISLLGLVTAMVLLTAYRVFYTRAEPVTLSNVGDVARQLEPLFGAWAKYIFCGGILAGALSSFLVNAMIGGVVMSDSLGQGSNLKEAAPKYYTVAALVVGMLVAIASLAGQGGTVHLITIAQALTVLGIPALALALVYLAAKKGFRGKDAIPYWMFYLAVVGFAVSCLLAGLTATKVYGKISELMNFLSR